MITDKKFAYFKALPPYGRGKHDKVFKARGPPLKMICQQSIKTT